MDFPSSESTIIDPNKSYSPPSPSGKLCVVTSYASSERENVFAIFIVDLTSPLPPVIDGGGFIPTVPTFFLDSGLEPTSISTACVLNSTLYLFQRCIGFENCFRQKSVYAYDLSPHLRLVESSTTTRNVNVVGKDMLRLASEMSSPKYLPKAIPTPDGKSILVFSTEISHPEFIDFELFHPLQKKTRKRRSLWKKLPSLQQYLKSIGASESDAVINIDSYGFITSSTFLIHIKFGVFTIDIDTPDPVWQKRCRPRNRVYSEGPVFGTESGTLWLTTSGAYDVSSNGYDGMSDPRNFDSFPISSFGNGFKRGDVSWSDMHTVCDERGELFGVVNLETTIEYHTHFAHMILDVCKFDLDKYRIDKKIVGGDAVLETTVFKSFRFVIDGEECGHFWPFGLSPIQQGTK